MVQAMGSSLHNLVADRFGDAMVVETGEIGNQITEIQDRYMVMTNFPIYQLKGKSYEDAEGIGSERYKIAHRYIRRNLKAFDTEKGMEVLKQAQSMSEIYPTEALWFSILIKRKSLSVLKEILIKSGKSLW